MSVRQGYFAKGKRVLNMEKKLLVIAKFLHQRRILKEKLDIMLYSEIAVIGETEISETIKIFQPQYIVCYLNQMKKADIQAVIHILKQENFLNSELILLGTEEECGEFKKEACMEMCIEVKRPISLNNFVLSLEAILDCRCREKLQMDVYKRDILVIDNDPVFLKSIKLWLEEAFRVSIVNSGDIGLKFLEEKNADLILMDYLMPKMDGKQTLQKIRSNPKTKDIPVFFLTGLCDNEIVQEVMKLNPQGYFLKTVHKEELLTAIASFLDVL